MHFNAYGGHRALLAAELANAALDRAPAAAQFGELLAEHHVSRPVVTREQVGQLLAWGDRLRPAFAGGPTLVGTLNELLEEATVRPYLSTHDGQPAHLHFIDDRADVVTRVRAMTAGGLAIVVTEAGEQRIGRCGAPGCERVYLDVSRGGNRAFCSRQCATRVNVAAHRERHRATS